MGHSIFAARGILVEHSHFLAIGIRTADSRGNRAFRIAQMPPANRQISPLDRVVFELPGKTFVRLIGLCDYQQAGCVLVDPVDDARPRDAPDTGKLAFAMVEQRIDQRPVRISGCGMHYHAGRLVHDDQMLILEHNIDRDILRPGFGFDGRWDADFKPRTSWNLGFRARHDLTGNGNTTFRDQRLNSRSRKIGRVSQRFVQPV